MRILYFVWIPLLGLSVFSLSAADLVCEEPLNDSAPIGRPADKEAPRPLASSVAGTSWHMENYNAVLSFGKEERWGGLVMRDKKSGATLTGSYTVRADRHIVGELGTKRGETFDFTLNDVIVTPERLTGVKSDGTTVSAVRNMSYKKKVTRSDV